MVARLGMDLLVYVNEKKLKRGISPCFVIKSARTMDFFMSDREQPLSRGECENLILLAQITTG
jgi:hypothetical protein